MIAQKTEFIDERGIISKELREVLKKVWRLLNEMLVTDLTSEVSNSFDRKCGV